MAGVGCSKCGAAIDASSRFCPSCGHATTGYGATLVGLEPVDASRPDDGDAVSKRAAKQAKKGETRSWVALALAAVVLLGGLMLLDRGSQDALDDAASEEADEAAGDSEPAEAATTTTTTTAVAERTTTTRPTIVTDPFRSPFPGESSFTDGAEPWGTDVDLGLGVDATLHLVGISGAIWSADLDSGEWNETVELDRGLAGAGGGFGGAGEPVDVREDHVVTFRDNEVEIFRFDRPDEPAIELDNVLRLLSSTGDDVVVMQFIEGPSFEFTYRSVDLEGNERWTSQPPGSPMSVGSFDDQLVIEWIGQTVLYAPDGGVTVAAEGPPFAVHDDALIWGDCSLDLTCVVRAGTFDQPDLWAFPDAEASPRNLFSALDAPLRVDVESGVLAIFVVEVGPGGAPQTTIEIHDETGLRATRMAPTPFGGVSSRILPGGEWIVIMSESFVELWNWQTDETRQLVAPMRLAAIDVVDG